jgi:hypothetical protein
VAIADVAVAKSTYQSAIPNPSANTCNTCHTDGGDTPRNAFGLVIEDLVLAAVPQDQWWAQVRELDSDGDGQSNAQELGDPCLTWGPGLIPDRTTSVSNPGDPLDLSMDPDACEDPPPAGEGEGEGEGGGGVGGGGGGSGMGNGDGSGMGNGNGDGSGDGNGNAASSDRWADPQWQYAEPSSGCQTSDGGDTQLAWWLLAVGLVLMARALRDEEATEPTDI